MLVHQGDLVRIIPCYGRQAVVSSVAADGSLMLSMMIAGRYQLRGPFMPEDVECVNA